MKRPRPTNPVLACAALATFAACGGGGGGAPPPPTRQAALVSLGVARVTSDATGTFVEVPLALEPGAGAGVLLQADLDGDANALRPAENPLRADQPAATVDGDAQGPGSVRILFGDGESPPGQPLQTGALATVRFEVLGAATSGTQTAITLRALKLVGADGSDLPVEGAGASAIVTLP